AVRSHRDLQRRREPVARAWFHLRARRRGAVGAHAGLASEHRARARAGAAGSDGNPTPLWGGHRTPSLRTTAEAIRTAGLHRAALRRGARSLAKRRAGRLSAAL